MSSRVSRRSRGLRCIVSALALSIASMAAAEPSQAPVVQTPVVQAPVVQAPEKLAFVAQYPALHPNHARGFDNSRVFATDVFDSRGEIAVNLFNGNAVLTRPLGVRYPLIESFDYGFDLVYNSNVWDRLADGTPLPERLSNAGLGFHLGFGELLHPQGPENPSQHWIYISPDGTPHTLYPNLHFDTPDPDDPNHDVYYTQDGSYLRVTFAGSQATIEHGDGSQSVFALVSGPRWRLTSRVAPGGRSLDITYETDGSWTLTDSHGRTHRAIFIADPTGHSQRLLQRLELESFGGGTAVYTFTYATTTIPKACGATGTVDVSLLQSVALPEGLSLAFQYADSSNGATCTDGGRLTAAQMASGGWLELDYQSHDLPSLDCENTLDPFWTSTTAVSARRLVRPDGTVDGVWTYDFVPDSPAACSARELVTSVSTPLGDRTDHFFSLAARVESGLPGGPADYALPYVRTATDSTGTRFLSRQTYDCDTSGASCQLVRSVYEAWEQDQLCTALGATCPDTNPRRYAQKTVYHDDVVDGTPRWADTEWSEFDGVGHYRSTVYTSNFGQADYRRVKTRFSWQTGDYQGVSYERSKPPHTFVMQSSTKHWAIATFDWKRWWENPAIVQHHEEYCFLTNGLEVARRLRTTPGARSADDVIIRHDHNHSTGDLVSMRWFGGDTQTLSTTNSVCHSASLPASPVYRLGRQLTGGVLHMASWTDAANVAQEHQIDRVIDVSTGLVAKDRVATGLEIDYGYDLLGRRVTEQPNAAHGGAWKAVAYRGPTGGSDWSHGAKSTTTFRENQNGAVLLTEREWYDVYGRHTGTQTELPGGVQSRKRFDYDAMGHLTAETTRFEPGVGGAAWRYELDVDPFGRPRTLRPYEGSSHDETIVYRGDREEERTVQVGTHFFGASSSNPCYENDATTTVESDRFGDVWRSETVRPNGLTRTLRYVRDARGWPTRRFAETDVNGVTEEIEDRMTWDGRGFRTNEQRLNHFNQVLLEIDRTVIDALGLSRDELHTPAYGGSKRLVQIYSEGGQLVRAEDETGRVAKEITYDLYGRMTQGVRHNWASGSTAVKVIYDVEHGAVGGAVSATDISLAQVGSVSQTRNFEYRWQRTLDDLGQLVSVDYPECQTTCFDNEPTIDRTVFYDRDRSALTTLRETRDGVASNWLTGIGYSTSLGVTSATHRNGVVDTRVESAARNDRTALHRSLGTNVDVEHGPIVYDGEGGVCGVMDTSYITSAQTPNPTLISTDPCLQSLESDLFGLPTGKSACGGRVPDPWYLYDVHDQLFATYDRSAGELQPYLVGGEVVDLWTPDSTKFRGTWYLRDADGNVLRQVESLLEGFDWQRTDDSIRAFGRDVALSRFDANTNYPSTHEWYWARHLMPGGLFTSAQGYKSEPFE